MKPVFTSSPMALETSRKPIRSHKYPWRTLEVGQSFLVEPGEANWTTISTACYKWSKKLGQKLRAFNHGDKGIEVARLPDDGVKQEINFGFETIVGTKENE